MEYNINIKPIGKVNAVNGRFSIQLNKKLLPALTNIQGFSHLQIIWWGHLYDTPTHRSHLVANKPYKKGPDKIGIFATHSPVRPNPVLLTTIQVSSIDYEQGIIYTPYIDAEDETPVLDIKPFHPEERVQNCQVPQWCNHWPKWMEESATFDWENEFNF